MEKLIDWTGGILEIFHKKKLLAFSEVMLMRLSEGECYECGNDYRHNRCCSDNYQHHCYMNQYHTNI